MVPIISDVVSAGGEFKLVTAGTSMMPLLRDRQDAVFLVKPSDKLRKFDIILYKRKNGSYVLHRIVDIMYTTDKSCEYALCGDNQVIFEHGIKNDDVIAVVSKISRNGKMFDLSKSKFYKLYVKFWCANIKRRTFLIKSRQRLAAILYKIFKKAKQKTET